ncbi:hypothetical protein RQCS_58710 (plasmid) [Rhodococcus qingshengii]|nr:hypothetical protein RQCS_58710 [Rhodococcus qingshengii]
MVGLAVFEGEKGARTGASGSSISWVRWARSRWESMDIVVSSSGLQVVLELYEEFVELVTFGFWESIAFCYAHLVVSPHSG